VPRHSSSHTLRRILYLLLTLLAVSAVAGDYRLAVLPAPAWAASPEVAANAAVPRNDVRYGIYALLNDHQVRIDESGFVTEYFRRVRKVLSPTAVQNASELSIDFDPSYQQLVLHEATLIRDGRRTNELMPLDIRFIDKENESDDKIYDGMLTAVVVLRDVRPGDVIDYSYSLAGANSLLGGRYADEFDFSSSVPVKTMRHRVIAPPGMKLFTSSRNPARSAGPGGRGGAQMPDLRAAQTAEYTWTRHDIVANDVEDSTPEWYDPWETVQVTEFASWNEVARWADDLFQPDPASLQAVDELAARIRRESPTRDAQITAAIRFVQDDIRYLGIEMGRNSHEPHQPAVTIRERYGDCKDKAFLLSLLLRNLGVQAYPAMVNTKLRRRLDDFLPSPFLFDHVITQVIDGKNSYWIDATLSDQGGTLGTIDTPNDERALVIRRDTQSLAKIDIRPRGKVRIEQTYTATDFSSPVVLDVVSTYIGRSADDLRARLATMSLTDLAKEQINLYAHNAPRIAAAGAPRVDDDRLRNTIVIRERYSVRDLWHDGQWTYVPRIVEKHLDRPETMVRTMPLSVEHPLDVEQVTHIVTPSRLRVRAREESFDAPSLRYARRVEVDGRRITISDRLTTTADFVPTERVADYFATLNDISRAIGFTVSQRDSVLLADAWGWPAGGAFLFVTLCTSLAVGRRRKRTRKVADRFDEQPLGAIGETDALRQIQR